MNVTIVGLILFEFITFVKIYNDAISNPYQHLYAAHGHAMGGVCIC
jgi:hypothetical protein